MNYHSYRKDKFTRRFESTWRLNWGWRRPKRQSLSYEKADEFDNKEQFRGEVTF